MVVKRFERWGALPVYRRKAMVATADQLATEAGVGVLREGGNAIDAAIAASFMLSVTQLGMCGIGGGGHLLARFADGTSLCLDFRERAPLSASRDEFATLPPQASTMGWLAAATPGTIKGFGEAHRLRGVLPWRRLVEPAIAVADEGHRITYLRSRMMAGCTELYEDPESFRLLLRAGHPLEPGDILRQPEVAATLRRIANHGPDEFYLGETGHRLAAAMRDNGGQIARKDLEQYRCVHAEPLRGRYRDHEIWAMPPSSAGGIGLLQILGILEGTPFADEGPGSSLFLHYAAEAMRRSFADRASCIGDPAFERVPLELLDPSRLAALRSSIDPKRATSSDAIPSNPLTEERSCTTHVSVIDAEGNAAALTFTLNGIFGSGVTVPGLGFLLNNNMDNFAVRPGTPNRYGVVQQKVNAIAPGKRPVSSMTPTIVCNGEGVEIVAGTPGGPTIVTALAQSLMHILEFRRNARDAAEIRRIHHQWMPDTLFLEDGFPGEVVRALEARGHRVQLKYPLTDMNMIVRRDGWLEGGVDSRRESVADGF